MAVNNKPRTIDLLHTTYAQQSMIGSGGYMPEDVQEIFADVCAHRVLLSQQAKTQQSTAQDVMQALLREVALPDAAF